MEKLNVVYDQDNITIYNNDNLTVLKNIPDGHVNLIYCDILYNTGKRFDDYNDDLGTPWEALKWYRPRFEEMKRVLAPNGSIFIHCNWRLDSYIRILMDEIFGENCFRNRIYRKHSDIRSFYRNFDSQVDIILYYVKDPNNFVFNESFTCKSKCKVVPLFENGYLKERSAPYKFGQTLIDLVPMNKHWLVTKEQFDSMAENNEVRIIDCLPYRFTNSVAISNLWDSPDMLDSYSRTDIAEAYDTPKPKAILDLIINTCSNEGDVVADFFMGGGTTAVVTKETHRKGIFCDISSKACEVTIKKLEAVKL